MDLIFIGLGLWFMWFVAYTAWWMVTDPNHEKLHARKKAKEARDIERRKLLPDWHPDKL